MRRTKQHGDPRLGAAIFIILGILSLVAGLVFFVVTRRKRKRCSAPVSAKVAENLFERSTIGTGSNKSSVSAYYPVFEFTFRGKKMRVKSNTGSYPPEYKIGDIEEIRVNPDNPQELVSGSGKIEVIVSAALIAFGLLFSGIGVLTALSI